MELCVCVRGWGREGRNPQHRTHWHIRNIRQDRTQYICGWDAGFGGDNDSLFFQHSCYMRSIAALKENSKNKIFLTFPVYLLYQTMLFPKLEKKKKQYNPISVQVSSLLWIPICVLSHFSHVWLFATPWTVAHQAPLSMGLSRKEYWSGLPCPPPGGLPDSGIESASLKSSALAGMF